MNNKVKDEVKRAVENLSEEFEHLDFIVNNKMEATEKQVKDDLIIKDIG